MFKEINTSYDATNHVTSRDAILNCTALKRSVFDGGRARSSLYSLDSYLKPGAPRKFDFDAKGVPKVITLRLALKR